MLAVQICAYICRYALSDHQGSSSKKCSLLKRLRSIRKVIQTTKSLAKKTSLNNRFIERSNSSARTLCFFVHTLAVQQKATK